VWIICVSIVISGIVGAVAARIMIDKFLKKVDADDELFREEMVEIVIQTIKENAFKTKPECKE